MSVRYHGPYHYLGGSSAAPEPYFGSIKLGEVRITDTDVEYWSMWMVPFTCNKLFSIPLDSITSVDAQSGDNTNLSTMMYGKDWTVILETVQGERVHFRARPLWAPAREKHARTFVARVKAAIGRTKSD